MIAIQTFEDLVIVSVLFVIVNSLRVALRTKPLCDQQGHVARRSRGGKSITVVMHGYIGHRSIIGRTSQRIRGAELQLFPCDLGDGRGFDEDIHLLPNVDGEAIGLESIYDLQDACIHAFPRCRR
jgi:hypothetical protein